MSGSRAFATSAGLNLLFDGRTVAEGNAGLAAGVDASHNMLTGNGDSRALNVTGAAVVTKLGPGRLCRVIVIVSAAATCGFNDCATTGAVAAANLMFTIPASAAVGTIYNIDCPFTLGLVSSPGAGVTVAVIYS